MRFIYLLLFLLSNVLADELKNTPNISGEVKLFFYDIDREDSQYDAYTTALGGFLELKSPSLYEINANIRFYTSNPIGADKFRESTLLYQVPSGDAINTLAVANLEYGNQVTTIILGRQRLSTPMANDDTSRIIPYAYSGITAVNKSLDWLKVSAGYIQELKPIISEDFDDISPAGKIEKGFYYLGVNVDFPYDIDLQAYGYYAYELYDALHLQLEKDFKFNSFDLKLGTQHIETFTNNDSKNLIPDVSTGSDEVRLWAYKIALQYKKLYLAHSFSQNEKLGGITRGYGGYTKLYTSSMYETAKSKGGARGINLSARYDFTDDLNAQVIYLKTNYKDPSSNPYISIYTGLKYYYYKNSYLHLRYEYVDREKIDTDSQYIRLITTYSF